MIKDYNLRIKNWRLDICIGDVLTKLTDNIQLFINYANNNDSILNTIDRLNTSNPKFRTFLNRINETKFIHAFKIQDLINAPWPHIKEMLNLLSSLQLYTPKQHPDQINIQLNLNRLRQFYVFLKQLQDRLEMRFKMIKIQHEVLDLPDISIIKQDRYLVLKQRGVLLNKQTLNFIKEITCFVFNDAILFTYRVRRHYPFTG
jgi:hypothetical protein